MMVACSLASSSSGLSWAVCEYTPVPLSSRLRRLPEVLECPSKWTTGTTMPSPIHISFFCSWPMSSFLRALRAATWDAREDGLRICVRIGATEGRVMANDDVGHQRDPQDSGWGDGRPIGRDERRPAGPLGRSKQAREAVSAFPGTICGRKAASKRAVAEKAGKHMKAGTAGGHKATSTQCARRRHVTGLRTQQLAPALCAALLCAGTPQQTALVLLVPAPERAGAPATAAAAGWPARRQASSAPFLPPLPDCTRSTPPATPPAPSPDVMSSPSLVRRSANSCP